MTLQLTNKTLIRPKDGEKLVQNGTKYELWREYHGTHGPFWNRVAVYREKEIMNVWDGLHNN